MFKRFILGFALGIGLMYYYCTAAMRSSTLEAVGVEGGVKLPGRQAQTGG